MKLLLALCNFVLHSQKLSFHSSGTAIHICTHVKSSTNAQRFGIVVQYISKGTMEKLHFAKLGQRIKVSDQVPVFV